MLCTLRRQTPPHHKILPLTLYLGAVKINWREPKDPADAQDSHNDSYCPPTHYLCPTHAAIFYRGQHVLLPHKWIPVLLQHDDSQEKKKSHKIIDCLALQTTILHSACYTNTDNDGQYLYL